MDDGLDAAEVKRRRKELSLTQAEAASRAGFTSPQQWANLEHDNGDIRSSTLATVARVLKCSMDDLMKSRAKPKRGGK